MDTFYSCLTIHSCLHRFLCNTGMCVYIYTHTHKLTHTHVLYLILIGKSLISTFTLGRSVRLSFPNFEHQWVPENDKVSFLTNVLRICYVVFNVFPQPILLYFYRILQFNYYVSKCTNIFDLKATF